MVTAAVVFLKVTGNRMDFCLNVMSSAIFVVLLMSKTDIILFRKVFVSPSAGPHFQFFFLDNFCHRNSPFDTENNDS